MKTPSQFARALLCLASALLVGGCSTATNALWQRQAYHPAEHPSISLWSDPQRRDILVRYYEERLNKTPHVRERAYWLFDPINKGSGEPGNPPFFVPDSELASLTNLSAIPVYHSKKDVKHSTGPDYVAFAGFKDRDFELWRNGKKVEAYQLPSYDSVHAPVTPWRVALTPGALTADAALNVGKGTGWFLKEAGENPDILIYFAGIGALQYYSGSGVPLTVFPPSR